MLTIPSRRDVSALADAVNAVIPSVAVGFSRVLDDDRVSVLYASRYGIGGYILAAADVPEVLSPTSESRRMVAALNAETSGAIEWQLFHADVRHLRSLPVPGVDPAARFWIGLAHDVSLTPDQESALDAVGATSARVLTASVPLDETAHQLQRLELAAKLLPALLRVLDVRGVFDLLSTISQEALPHDMLTLGVFNDDCSMLTLFARTGRGSDVGRRFPQPYPKSVMQTWEFDIIDDRLTYPLEQDRPPTKLGMRSSLRIPFRFEGRSIGGLGIHAFEAGKYSNADIVVARRIADYVALALSHHRLAE